MQDIGAGPLCAVDADKVARLPSGLSHNTYGLYVTDESDLIGLVAYSLYKRQKIAFLDQQLAKTQTNATKEQVDTFCAVLNAPNQVEMLRDKASNLLEAMNEALLDVAVQNLNEEYQKQLVAGLKEGQSLSKSLFYGVLGNLATAAFVAFVLFGVSSAKIGVFPTLANWVGYNATPIEEKAGKAP